MLKTLPIMQRVKSTNCKVNLALFVGDWTHANLFEGLYHMLSCCIVTCYVVIALVSYTLLGDF